MYLYHLSVKWKKIICITWALYNCYVCITFVLPKTCTCVGLHIFPQLRLLSLHSRVVLIRTLLGWCKNCLHLLFSLFSPFITGCFLVRFLLSPVVACKVKRKERYEKVIRPVSRTKCTSVFTQRNFETLCFHPNPFFFQFDAVRIYIRQHSQDFRTHWFLAGDFFIEIRWIDLTVFFWEITADSKSRVKCPINKDRETES